jgi:hypothetical protein
VANAFDSILDTLDAINNELNVLTARVNAIEQGGPRAGTGTGSAPADGERVPGAPVVWSQVPDDLRAALWEDFVDWTLWIADTYELTAEQLPRACWWRHGSAVEELTALWTAYQSAYHSSEDQNSATYLWQDALARCVERLNRVWLGACTNGYHDAKTRTDFQNDEAYRIRLVTAVGGGPETETTPEV